MLDKELRRERRYKRRNYGVAGISFKHLNMVYASFWNKRKYRRGAKTIAFLYRLKINQK